MCFLWWSSYHLRHYPGRCFFKMTIIQLKFWIFWLPSYLTQIFQYNLGGAPQSPVMMVRRRQWRRQVNALLSSSFPVQPNGRLLIQDLCLRRCLFWRFWLRPFLVWLSIPNYLAVGILKQSNALQCISNWFEKLPRWVPWHWWFLGSVWPGQIFWRWPHFLKQNY